MLKQHKNILLDAVVQSKLGLSWFLSHEEKGIPVKEPLFDLESLIVANSNDKQERLIQIKSLNSFSITVKDSRMKFAIPEHPRSYDHFTCRYAKFKFQYRSQHTSIDIKFKGDIYYIPEPLKYWDDIDITTQYLTTWLAEDAARHIKEQTTADLWEMMNYYGNIAANKDISDDDTAPFATEEKRRIIYSLNDFGRRVTREYKPNSQQLEFITERLQYLSVALDRLNRFDWKGLAISIVVSIGINLGVDTETGRQLYELFLLAMHSIPYILPS